MPKSATPIYADSPARRRLATVLGWIGMKQAELARRLDEKPNWVSRRMTGETPILADEVPRFAEALRVGPAVLFDDGEMDRFMRGVVTPSSRAAIGRKAQPWADRRNQPSIDFNPARRSLEDAGVEPEAADALVYLAEVIARQPRGA